MSDISEYWKNLATYLIGYGKFIETGTPMFISKVIIDGIRNVFCGANRATIEVVKLMESQCLSLKE